MGEMARPLRLAELIGALSLATDLGLGLPQEHVLRQCRIAVALGEVLGLGDDELAAAYYVALLAWVGCTADSHELAALFGDDIALRAQTYGTDMAGLPMLGFMLRRVGTGRGALQRGRMAAALVVTGGREVATAMTAHCQAASVMAERLGLGPEVCGPLTQVFARWDGKGLPDGFGGGELAMAVRLVQLADIVEVRHRDGGIEAARTVARERSGRQVDPALAEAFCDNADAILGGLEDEPSWEAVIAAEPGTGHLLAGDGLDEALSAVGDFADLKSPWLTGHSRGVAALAEHAARGLGLADDDAETIRRAALVHDIGRVGVPNTIWDKPGPLSDRERERVRLHSYFTERMLARPASLARLGALAACHHERLDGSGYHRALPGSALSPAARVLAAADAYQAMTEPRPYRPALDAGTAAAELRADVRAGRLDGDAAEEVLASAGHRRASRREHARPAGLTARELEVLMLVARGATARDVARELVIADKTARNHIERIYSKIGVSTRSGAALFAMRYGLVEPLA
jgi:HD-GYP domain-containing protein (c-di-GMP phosphodiesterase class II)